MKTRSPFFATLYIVCLRKSCLTQIKERIADLKAGTSEEESEENLKTKIKKALTKINKSKAWTDPKKQKRLQKILREL